jgi:signal transduction histidine kinase
VLAERFSASLPTVCQAFYELMAAGLLVLQPKKGIRVQPSSLEAHALTSIRGTPVVDEGFVRLGETQTETMLRIALAAGSSLALDDVLSQVVQAMTTFFERRFSCMVVLVSEEQEVLTFKRGAISDTPNREVLSALGYFTRPVSYSEVDDLTREVLRYKMPSITYDIENDSRIAHDLARQWGNKSLLGVPVIANDQMMALAWLISRDCYHAFNRKEIDLALSIATVVAPALMNARLHCQVEEHAILEERQRLSRELHDNLAQALGILKIKSALAAELLSARQSNQVDTVLREIQDVAAQAYTDVREAIFGLRCVEPEERGFVPSLQQYLNHYRASFGVDVNLVLHENEAVSLEPEDSAQALRIVQEALSNVRKHAHIGVAQVTIDSSSDSLCVCIQDKGSGFDLAAIDRQMTQGVGLSVMRERAQSMGGHIEIESEPGRGTRVTLHVPQGHNLEEEPDAPANSAGG